MLTKNKIQFIKNLHEKSGRHESGLFLVEWRKGIMEFMGSDFEIVEGYFTPKFVIPDLIDFPYEIISEKELERISTLKSNEAWLIVVKMRVPLPISPISGGTGRSNIPIFQHSDWLTLILDGINDPGNLGTIIRIADWYGISRIIATLDTVDCYNSKVIMATMWSFTRVYVEYRDLEEYLTSVISTDTRQEQNGEILPEKKLSKISRLRSAPLEITETLPKPKIYWAYLEGESIRTKKFTPLWWYLVIGSESHGIRPYLEPYITDKITIPRFGDAESLNAWVATAVILERVIG